MPIPTITMYKGDATNASNTVFRAVNMIALCAARCMIISLLKDKMNA